MTSLEFKISGADVLRPDGWSDAPLHVAGGAIANESAGRAIDLSGYLVLPGIVDAHGDGFERHLARRRGAMMDMEQGVLACAAELAANGITTAMLAQFFSWEGGMRGPDFARAVISAVAEARGQVVPDLRVQLRFETHMLDDYSEFEALVRSAGISYVVFNDHLPHEHLSAGKRPPRLTGTALKSGRNPEKHLELMQVLHTRSGEVAAQVADLAGRLSARGVRLGSHDDNDGDARALWRGHGARIAEFPQTREAALTARDGGDAIVLGAPNVTRGGSHNGNVSAQEMIAEGLCDALASDYHYPSPRRAALMLAERGVCSLSEAWKLVSSGPAHLLGLGDRGDLGAGQRADLVILDAQTHAVAACFAAGRLAYMSGPVAARFFN